MKLIAIIIGIIWLLEIVVMIGMLVREYRKDCRRYGKDAARRLWKGRR